VSELKNAKIASFAQSLLLTSDSDSPLKMVVTAHQMRFFEALLRFSIFIYFFDVKKKMKIF
jgi:hypothetical protein